MKIGIIGQGFVGSAIKEGLKKHYKVKTFDIEKSKCNSTHEEVCCNSDIVFVCLPTPMRVDGSCDIRILETAIDEVHNLCRSVNKFPVVVIKSTIPPGTTSRINLKYKDMCVLFSPEFLTEANSFKDFKNQTRIIIGSQKDYASKNAAVKVKKMFRAAFPPLSTEIVIADSCEAEMCKYFINCFLATKVTFANQMFQVCLDNNIKFKNVVDIALLDKRIGKSHFSVPGPDGDLGFGGHCFPKDLSAIISLGSNNSGDTSFLSAVQEYNDKCRKFRDWEMMKGRAVSDD